MAKENLIRELDKEVELLLSLKDKDLVTRDEWGSINFSDIQSDIDIIFEIASSLSIFPTQSLPNAPAQKIQQGIKSCKNNISELDSYDIEQSNHMQVKLQLIDKIKKSSDSLLELASPWIPYLAYKQGDVATNIEKLTSALSEAEEYTQKAKARIKTKEKEVDTIVTQAREASASAGAAVFTQDFLNRSKELESQARLWLTGTAFLGFITFISALYFWSYTPEEVDTGTIWLSISGKITVLVVLFAATIWCGKIYRIIMHQATENKHKALGLKTFQAFSNAASDDATKNAVLKETTRSIFSNAGSGYVDGKTTRNDGELNIIEVIRSAINGNK